MGTKQAGQGGPAGSAPNFHHQAEWEAHRGTCACCKGVDIAKPATLARACLGGLRLLKDHLSALHRRQEDKEDMR